MKNSKTENQATHKFVSDVVNDNPLTNFTFTGKDTDLSYFLQSERMPVSAIRNIADSDIKDAVTNTFVKAAVKRDCSSRELVMKRIEAQMSDEVKRSHADFVIVNDDETPLIPQVLELISLLSKNNHYLCSAKNN